MLCSLPETTDSWLYPALPVNLVARALVEHFRAPVVQQAGGCGGRIAVQTRPRASLAPWCSPCSHLAERVQGSRVGKGLAPGHRANRRQTRAGGSCSHPSPFLLCQASDEGHRTREMGWAKAGSGCFQLRHQATPISWVGAEKIPDPHLEELKHQSLRK